MIRRRGAVDVRGRLGFRRKRQRDFCRASVEIRDEKKKCVYLRRRTHSVV